jgi:N-methylhydantoinase B
LADRTKFAAPGLQGGEDGKVARYQVIADGKLKKLPSKGSVVIKLGETVRVETCGGGGYGPAQERDPELVLRDVREERVTLARARKHYRVAVNAETWTIDEAETDRLRENVSWGE